MDTNVITDENIQSVLAAAVQTRAQCMAMLDFLDQNRVTSLPPTESLQLDLSRQQKILTSHLARLRGLHRNIIYIVRSTKGETGEAKSEIDTLHLQLQNLFYEQRHLRGEIAACEGYDHKYQSLGLISVDEFLVSRPELSEANDHDVMIARINHEHMQRQALEEQRQGLLKKKQSLIAENKKKKDELDSLDKEVEKFLLGAATVQKIFDTRLQKETVAAAAATT